MLFISKGLTKTFQNKNLQTFCDDRGWGMAGEGGMKEQTLASRVEIKKG